MPTIDAKIVIAGMGKGGGGGIKVKKNHLFRSINETGFILPSGVRSWHFNIFSTSSAAEFNSKHRVLPVMLCYLQVKGQPCKRVKGFNI